MSLEKNLRNLPYPWSYGVVRDGRIFFINDESRTTSWLHPMSMEAVRTGHRYEPGLPRGWERGITTEGTVYYIDHNRQETTLVNPFIQKSLVQTDAIQSSVVPTSTANSPNSNTISSPLDVKHTLCESSSALTASNTLSGADIRRYAATKKKIHGSSWVKSPGSRRPLVTPITHQGWMYKQGGDGLHLWKKRWFVLSEFCLYYYKGPNDEKVLGSLPMPSFKISPVDSEDRVFRRHAFKAEHQNMRTYYFAAETKEQMTQWMNALSLATILQKDTSSEDKSASSGSTARRSDRPSLSSVASTASPSPDGSDSGFHGYRSRQFRSPDGFSLDEISDHSRGPCDRLNVSFDSSLILQPRRRQPLYANAPPKPKRLNTSREYSPSPDRRSEAPSETSRLPKDSSLVPSSERRTPDAYAAAAAAADSGFPKGEYEDVYGEGNEAVVSPHPREPRDSFSSNKSNTTRLSEEILLSNSRLGYRGPPYSPPPHLEVFPSQHFHKLPPGPPRPHSADFLEYDRHHGPSDMFAVQSREVTMPEYRVERPKSSFGYGEHDYWSEENYAQKIRQSTLLHTHFHDNRVFSSNAAKTEFFKSPTAIGPRIPPAGAATPDLYVTQSPSYPNPTHPMPNCAPPLQKSSEPQPSLTQSRSKSTFLQDAKGFLRSASARLPKQWKKNGIVSEAVSSDVINGEDRKSQQTSVNSSFDQSNTVECNAFSPLHERGNHMTDPGERPVPQGASAVSSSSSVLVDDQRDYFRRDEQPSRHTNAADSKRFTRFNYSSDEEDMEEERETRKKHRRISKKSTSESPRRSNDFANSDSIGRIEQSRSADIIYSPDYVNINLLKEKETTNGCSEKYCNQKTHCERAEPVYIDAQEHSNRRLGNSDKNSKINGMQELSTDPYKLQQSLHTSHHRLKTNCNEICDNSYIKNNRIEGNGQNNMTNYAKTSVKFSNVQNLSTDCSYDIDKSHTRDKIDNSYIPLKEGYLDDLSTGKYSDSGYDTLKTEVFLKKGGREHSKVSWPSNVKKEVVNIRKRQVHRDANLCRPETWSPDKFHEYWFHSEKQHENIKCDVKNSKLQHINSQVLYNTARNPSPLLPSLESPKVVQETSLKNLVQKRIEKFSADSDEITSKEISSYNGNQQSTSGKEFLNEPLEPQPHLVQSSEALVSSLKAEFATPESKVIHAHEAQVKSISVGRNEVNKRISKDKECNLNAQPTSDLSSNQLNIRRFIFNDLDVTLESNEEKSLKPELGIHQYDINKKSSEPALQEFIKQENIKLFSDSEVLSDCDDYQNTGRGNLCSYLPVSKSNSNYYFEGPNLPPLPSSTMSSVERCSPLLPPPRPPKKFAAGSDVGSGDSSLSRLSLAESIQESLKILGESDSGDECRWQDSSFQKNNIQDQTRVMYLSSDNNTVVVDIDNTSGRGTPAGYREKNEIKTSVSAEENYLPMSPPKKNVNALASGSSNSSLSSKHLPTPEPPDMFKKSEFEEHTYIEMTGDNHNSVANSVRCSPMAKLDICKTLGEMVSPESPRYYEIGEKDEIQHYEYIYKAASHYESIYMEVPNGDKEKNIKEVGPKIPSKSFLLKQQNEVLKTISENGSTKLTGRCDGSSDADDEASKVFDSLDAPKNPRFSLSDTFRPASYYLSGGEPTSDLEAHDSSDSDLVSPPPIPLSPPPMEDLTPDDESINKIVFDLPEVFNAKQSFSESQRPDNNPVVDYNESEQLLNIRSRQFRHHSVMDSFKAESEEDKFILRSEDRYPASAAYPEGGNAVLHDSFSEEIRKELNHPGLGRRSKSSLSNPCPSYYNSKCKSNNQELSLCEDTITQDDSSFYKQKSSFSKGNAYLNIPFNSKLHSMDVNNTDRSISPELYAMQNEVVSTYQNVPTPRSSLLRKSPYTVEKHRTESPIVADTRGHSPSVLMSVHQRSTSELLPRDVTCNTANHRRGFSNLSTGSETSPRTAPYYYSDVIRDDAPSLDCSLSSYCNESYQLNNQRGLEANKRQDIGRNVNEISNGIDSLHYDRFDEGSLNHFGEKLWMESGRHTLSYGPSHKIRSQTPDKELLMKRDISFHNRDLLGQGSQRRARSLEGLLNDSSAGFWSSEQESRQNSTIKNQHCDQSLSVSPQLGRDPHGTPQQMTPEMNHKNMDSNFASLSSSPYVGSSESDSLKGRYLPSVKSCLPLPKSPKIISKTSIVDRNTSSTSMGFYHHSQSPSLLSQEDESWEDDTQWREQLRRASLRHTKSLETLDETRPKKSPDGDAMSFSKLSLPRRNFATLEDPARRPLSRLNDEYYVDYREGRIAPKSDCPETLDRTRRGLTSVEDYDWDPAEEKFKRHLAPPPVAGISLSQHFLAEGLPPPEDKETPCLGGSCSSVPGSEGRPHDEERPASSPRPQEISQPPPDVVPVQDVSKFADSLNRRSADASKMVQNRGGFPENLPEYHHWPNPNSQNSYHHFKNNDLTAPYSDGGQQYFTQNNRYAQPANDVGEGYGGGYAGGDYNYPSYKNLEYLRDPVKRDKEYYRQTSYNNYNYDMENYRNGRNQSLYGTYDRRARGDRYEQFSDSDVSITKKQIYPEDPPPPPRADKRHQDSLSGGINGVSAGELLGKTHEELVLLLIQLRRHHAALQAARLDTRRQRHDQPPLETVEREHREEYLRRLANLNQYLHDLDKQYEMGKPLINLVDNMVKLGSLYRGNDKLRRTRYEDTNQNPNYDSLEFTRRVQEQRIVAEDRQEYEHIVPDQKDLEDKVMLLYKLDKALHEESLTIQCLQREKDMLESTLYALNSQYGRHDAVIDQEWRLDQRRHLERELSKLKAHLAFSARRLEETAAENSRLEHEMMMLRQKIQANMVYNAKTEITSPETRHIESEMIRVQNLLEDLQRRRIELSHQIQRLTSNSANENVRPSPTGVVGAAPVPARKRSNSTWLETDLDSMITRDRGEDPPVRRNAPVYVNASGLSPELEHMLEENFEADNLKYSNVYRPELSTTYAAPDSSPLLPEFDIHKAIIDQHFEEDFDKLYNSDKVTNKISGLDRNSADNKPDGEEQEHQESLLNISEADERMKRFYGILPKEKVLEPKTVRIVKRESTERRKDKFVESEKRENEEEEDVLSLVLEDEHESDADAGSDTESEPQLPPFVSRTSSLPRSYGRRKASERFSMMSAMMRTNTQKYRPDNLSLNNRNNWRSKNGSENDRPLSAHEQLFGFARGAERMTPPSSPSKSDPPSLMFKSHAAREIVKEMASEAEKYKRNVPKEKRRHFTISSSNPLALETNSVVDEGARSRDDCDMVRALRPRNHPDVVKSTLSARDLRFNESTIDSILGTPNKIYIPERYMPDEDDERELTEEEKVQRQQKAEAIRKMLTESATSVTASGEEDNENNYEITKSRGKLVEEKKEREHLLALNQILARQVMEKSRVVAVRALTTSSREQSSSDEDLSPVQQLPLIQQRENYLV